MDFKTKRRCKRKAKLLFSLAWGVTIFWVLLITYGIYLIFTQPHLFNDQNIAGFRIFLLYFSPLILGLILGMIGQEYINKRIKYKAHIKEYRQRRFFTQIIDLLRRGNINDAVIMYNKLLKDDTFRNFIFPFIICESIHSTDDNRKKIYTDKLYNILEAYNPDKIIF